MAEMTFSATITQEEKKGGWTYLLVSGSSEFLGTRKAVKVSGTIDGHEFEATFLPNGDGRHLLPLRAALLKAIDKKPGDEVQVSLRGPQ